MGKVAKRPNEAVAIVKKQQIFLDHLRKTGLIEVAARKARIKPHLPHRWARESEDFDSQFREAENVGREVRADQAESEMVRRGRDGKKVKRWYQGKPVGEDIEHSDLLLLAELRANRPERFRETGIGIAMSSTGPTSIKIILARPEQPEPIDVTPDSTSEDS